MVLSGLPIMVFPAPGPVPGIKSVLLEYVFHESAILSAHPSWDNPGKEAVFVSSFTHPTKSICYVPGFGDMKKIQP